ncbi:DUF2605 domain-containing protein [Planktothrix sp. FACHB-1355]|uniref:DUF2605 domain-containing protein n=1 Tax=Aerosakkonema funiforme FACHB-1375 TaxID=2949571 RepID=A0A926ZJ85_9CYAN|nr:MULTISPECIES: DUF2605 domain-containing protein [Oscillatoriales]MBD2185273.1 DUF2605 domain-containing protein [Aerosakkonema funiforme FACHB-1375]MBD3563339.1 DUF2605 domain-containing protein [Planktothrix sp. FACHB-1355]
MLNSNLPEPELLKTLLQPLLEDFQYWFGRSRDLLETEEIAFLSREQQSDLLERVKNAQNEVSTVHMLYKATGGQAGVETATLMPWHRLLMECWQVGMRFRMEQSTKQKQDE